MTVIVWNNRFGVEALVAKDQREANLLAVTSIILPYWRELDNPCPEAVAKKGEIRDAILRRDYSVAVCSWIEYQDQFLLTCETLSFLEVGAPIVPAEPLESDIKQLMLEAGGD